MAYPQDNPKYNKDYNSYKYPNTEEKRLILEEGSFFNISASFVDAPSSEYPDISSEYFVAGSFELERSLPESEYFNFGTICSKIKFTLLNYPVDSNKLIGHSLYIDIIVVKDNIYPYSGAGYFTIDSVASKSYNNGNKEIEIVAYDYMKKFDRDVSTWYESLYPTVQTTKTISEILSSLIKYIGVTTETNSWLPQWVTNINIPKTITTNSLNSRDVLNQLCQISGVCMYFDVSGKLCFTSENLLTNEIQNNIAFEYIPKERIIQGTTEDSGYYTDPIKRIVLGSDQEDIGCIVEHKDYDAELHSTYYILDNMFLYGMSDSQLREIGELLLNRLNNFTYRVMNLEYVGHYIDIFPGCNYYIESPLNPGSTSMSIKTSVIQKMNIKGLTNMTISIESKGKKKRPDLTTRDNFKEIQLKKKMMKLSTTVDGISAEIQEISSDMKTLTEDVTRIDATAKGLGVTVQQHSQSITSLESDVNDISGEVKTARTDITSLQVTAQGLQTQVSSKVGNNEIISKINQSAETITINASKINLIGAISFDSFNASTQEYFRVIQGWADDANTTIGEWCYNNNKTFIDGGKLATGTVIADNIRANTTISNHIEATNLQVSGNSKIANWYLSENSIYNGVPFTGTGFGGNNPTSNSTGMGTWDGSTWAFWAGDGVFYVKQNGEFQATKGTIGGLVIDGSLGLGILPAGQTSPSFVLSVPEQSLVTYDASTQTGVKIGWGNILIQKWNNDGTRTDISSISTGQVVFGSNLLCTGSGTFWGGVSSDERLKNNIEDADTRYLNIVKEIKPKLYCYNEDKSNRRRIGVIAQDLLYLCEKYNIINETNGLVIEDSKGMYGVDYNGLAVAELLWLRELESRLAKIEEKLFEKEE